MAMEKAEEKVWIHNQEDEDQSRHLRDVGKYQDHQSVEGQDLEECNYHQPEAVLVPHLIEDVLICLNTVVPLHLDEGENLVLQREHCLEGVPGLYPQCEGVPGLYPPFEDDPGQFHLLEEGQDLYLPHVEELVQDIRDPS